MNPSYQKALDAFDHLTTSEEDPVLQCVYEKIEDECRTELYLGFQKYSLVFHVDIDWDTLDVRCIKNGKSTNSKASVHDQSPWKSLIGAPFGWGWITINQQGYQDGALLSFRGLFPTLALVVTASNLDIFELKESKVKAMPTRRRRHLSKALRRTISHS